MLKVIFINNNITQPEPELMQVLNLMTPTLVDIGLNPISAKVTLKYQGQIDEKVKHMLQKADGFDKAFRTSCEAYTYHLDYGIPAKCYMLKKPISYEYSDNDHSDQITVKIEFGECYCSPSINKKCKEIEKMRYYGDIMRKLMKDDLDEKFNNPGNDDMKHDNETKTTTTTRISKPEYYLKIAEAVSLRGTCLRRKFGSIIVKDDRIVSTGYAGAPRGRINCCDRGTCFRIEHNIPSGEAYHKCRSTHSEMNAVIQASPEEMKDATLYLVGIENDGSYTNADCCTICKRIIINSGIKNVIARQADGSYTDTPIQSWIDDDDTLDIDHKGY